VTFLFLRIDLKQNQKNEKKFASLLLGITPESSLKFVSNKREKKKRKNLKIKRNSKSQKNLRIVPNVFLFRK